jgi:hypothetical protein
MFGTRAKCRWTSPDGEREEGCNSRQAVAFTLPATLQGRESISENMHSIFMIWQHASTQP